MISSNKNINNNEVELLLPSPTSAKEAKIVQVENNIENEVKIKELEDYLEKYVYEGNNFKFSKKELGLKYIAALLGAAWGVPWRDAAASAAVIFPEGLSRQIFEKIFAGGIVLTVGGDGLWIMLEIANTIGNKSAEEKKLTQKQDTTCVKISQAIFPALFSFFSCISAVYASVKYNAGPQKLLGILTFIDNYAYGFYGYSKLTRSFHENVVKPKSDHDYKKLLEIRNKCVNKVNAVVKGAIPKPESSDEFMKFMLSSDDIQNNVILGQLKGQRFKKLFQYFSTAMISISSSIIGVFLAKEFLKDKIYDNAAFAFTVAILSEVPGFIVTCISTDNRFGRFFELLFCLATDESRRALVKEIYPIASLVIPAVILPISLTAPTAGAYVTYNTFGEEDTSSTLQWLATSSIIAARVVFSNFTLNALTEEFLLKFYEMRHSKEDPINEKMRLMKFANLVDKTNVVFFKPVLQQSIAANNPRTAETVLNVRRSDEDEEISQTVSLQAAQVDAEESKSRWCSIM